MLEHLPLIVFLVTFVLIFVLRMPIPAGMIAACTLYFLTDGLIKGVGFGALITGAGGSLHLVAQKTIEAIFTNGTIVAVPLFIFAANVMNAGKITEYVFGTCMGLVGRFRGGLAHVNVLASLVFSGMTGSAIADASGLGKLEIDAMRKEGYDDGFSCAITAASATIGPIFPPSIPMVVYAMLTGASVGALFMAGMVPGVLLAVALCVYVYFVAKKRNYPRTAPPKLRDYLLYLTKSIWAMLTPVILLVGIYTGIMTPTEAGAIAGLYALLVSFLIYRLMSWRTLKQVLVDTMKGTGSVSIMIGAASAISFYLCQRADRHDPRQLAAQRHGQQVRLPVCRQHHHPDPWLPGRYLGHPACHDPDPMAGRGGDGHQHHPFRPHHLLQHDGRSVHAAVRHVPVHHLGHIRHAAQGYHSGDLVADHRHADRARRDHLHPRRGAVPAKAHRYDGLI